MGEYRGWLSSHRHGDSLISPAGCDQVMEISKSWEPRGRMRRMSVDLLRPNGLPVNAGTIEWQK